MSEVLSSAEFWAAITAGVVSVGGAAYKVYMKFKKVMDAHAEKTSKELKESIDRTVSEYNHVRGQQIRYAEEALTNYAVCVTQHAEEAAKSWACSEKCENIELLTELWQHAVHKTMTKNVLGYFVWMIDKGFSGYSDAEFELWIDREVSLVFNHCLNSMRSFFHNQKIRTRIDWIEKNNDRGYMRQVVSQIMHECRDLSEKFHK